MGVGHDCQSFKGKPDQAIKIDGFESPLGMELLATDQLLQSRDFKHDPDDPGKKERYQHEPKSHLTIWFIIPSWACR